MDDSETKMARRVSAGHLVCQQRELLLTVSAQIVPVHDGIETHDECALSLPAPERTYGEHHHVSSTDRRVDHIGAIGQILSAFKHSR